MSTWAEVHGYTNRCPGCGQLTDSDFCSSRCESETHALDLLAAGEEDEREEADMLDGVPDVPTYGDAKHERAEYDRERKEA